MIERVQRGVPVRLVADEWNQIANVVDEFARPDNYSSPNTQLQRVYAEPNASAPSHGFLQIVGPVPIPSADLSQFIHGGGIRGAIPKADDSLLGGLVQPVASIEAREGKLAQPDGIIRCRVNVLDIQHQYAHPLTNDSKELQSGGMGYRIVWKENPAATGVMWALVRLSHWGYTVVTGTTTAIIPVGGSGPITVDGGMIGDGATYTVWDYFGEQIGSGVKVWAMHTRPDKASVFAAACETSSQGGGPVNP